MKLNAFVLVFAMMINTSFAQEDAGVPAGAPNASSPVQTNNDGTQTLKDGQRIQVVQVSDLPSEEDVKAGVKKEEKKVYQISDLPSEEEWLAEEQRKKNAKAQKYSYSKKNCEEKVPKANQAKCTYACALQKTDALVDKCVESYKIEYSWIDDSDNRKIISAGSCGGKICIGRVAYKDADGNEASRLAVCGSENCKDDNANACARQLGYGSKSYSDVKSKAPKNQPAAGPQGARQE